MFKSYGVALIGMLTSVLTALLLWFLEHRFGFGIYGFSILFIIPVGAIGSGLVAASGYWYAARKLNRRPTWGLLVTMLLISAGCYVLIQYLHYRSASVVVDEKTVSLSQLVSFFDFWKLMVEQMSLGRAGRDSMSGELGQWGYVFAALQVIGFALGGVFVYFLLAATPWCEGCYQFLTRRALLRRKSAEPEALQPMLERLEGQPVQVWPELVASFGEGEKVKKAVSELSLEERGCPVCARLWRKLEIKVQQKGQWSTIWQGASFVDAAAPETSPPDEAD